MIARPSRGLIGWCGGLCKKVTYFLDNKSSHTMTDEYYLCLIERKVSPQKDSMEAILLMPQSQECSAQVVPMSTLKVDSLSNLLCHFSGSLES